MSGIIGKIADLFRRQADRTGGNTARDLTHQELTFKARSIQPGSEEFVYIEDDGSARQLEPDEVEYLNEKFEGGDGNRPYIKISYDQRTPDYRLHGYLPTNKLPANVRVKSIQEFSAITTSEEAIEIAKLKLPLSYCCKSGIPLGRVIDQRTGKLDFGLPGVDVASADFTAELVNGVWRVTRTPLVSTADAERPCLIKISARSRRVMSYGLF